MQRVEAAIERGLKTYACNTLVCKLDQALSIDDDIGILLLINDTEHLDCLSIHCCGINFGQHALFPALQAHVKVMTTSTLIDMLATVMQASASVTNLIFWLEVNYTKWIQ